MIKKNSVMGLINSFNKWLERLFCGGVDKEEFERNKTRERAKELYQVNEHNGMLWLTYNGSRVCPISMFETGDAVAVLAALRDFYFSDIHGSTENGNAK